MNAIKRLIRRICTSSSGQLVLAAAVFVWVVMMMIPFRLAATQRSRLNENDTFNSRDVFFITRAYNQVKTLPMSDERRLKAAQELARVCWRIGEYKTASSLYKEIWETRAKMK